MSLRTYIVQGKAKWTKLLGEPRPGYDESSKEWSVDLYLDEEGKKEFLASGADKFYVKSNEDGEFVRFVRKATKADGSAGRPVSVEDDHGQPWDQQRLIGNGSILNIKYSLNTVKSKGQMRNKPSIIAVQVWNHEPFKPTSSFTTRKEGQPQETATVPEEW